MPRRILLDSVIIFGQMIALLTRLDSTSRIALDQSGPPGAKTAEGPATGDANRRKEPAALDGYLTGLPIFAIMLL